MLNIFEALCCPHFLWAETAGKLQVRCRSVCSGLCRLPGESSTCRVFKLQLGLTEREATAYALYR